MSQLRTQYARARKPASGDGRMIHGLGYSKISSIWSAMKQRCYDKKADSYKFYGARGIKVCDRWLASVVNFFDDMGHPPVGMTIERIDTDGNYEPSNCQWKSAKLQTRNRRSNRFLTYGGKTLTVAEWAERSGISGKSFASRLARGWSLERILSTPIRASACEHKTRELV